MNTCRVSDPAGTRYLRFALNAAGQLRRLERGVVSQDLSSPSPRIDDPDHSTLAIAEATQQGDVRVNDHFGTRYSRWETGSDSVARELQERQVSLPVGFALFARAALSRPSYAAFYYRRDFMSLFGQGDLEEKVVSQQMIYRRRETVELFRQVVRTMQMQGDGLEAASPLMWHYLDRYFLPLLPVTILGSDSAYDRITDDPAACREEAISS